MNTATIAQAAVAPGKVQHVTVIPGVHLDQDGNRYKDAATKLAFLRDCLESGIRSGNLQPITTVNQCNDLIARINATAAEAGAAPLTEIEMESARAAAGKEEEVHGLRMRAEAKMRVAFITGRSDQERKNNVPFNGAAAMDKIHAMSTTELTAFVTAE